MEGMKRQISRKFSKEYSVTSCADSCGHAGRIRNNAGSLWRRLTGMDCLAPDDFHAVRAQFDPLFTQPGETTHEMLVSALEKEAELKIEPKARRVGFLG